MKRIIRLTEKDLTKLVKKIMKEGDPGDGTRDDFSEYEGRTDIYADNIGTEKKDDDYDYYSDHLYGVDNNK